MSRPADSTTIAAAAAASPPLLWWESLSDDIECAITLEPIRTLSYPPFVLRKQQKHGLGGNSDNDDDILYYFDGLALASYIVSRGIFQNPLTREPLSWDDCRRLDQYLDDYCLFDPQKGRTHHGNNNNHPQRFEVLEAFALRESVQVRARGSAAANSNQVVDEARQRRADFLRSEATAALSGLFVYGTAAAANNTNSSRTNSNRRTRQSRQHLTSARATIPPTNNNHNNASLEPNPLFGFNLNPQQHAPDTNDNDDDGYGMVVIDDDDQVRLESEDTAYQQLQEAFPRLATQQENDHDGSAQVVDESIMMNAKERVELIKQQAERDRQQEWVRQRALKYARQQLEQEVLQRKVERQQDREATKAKAEQVFQKQQHEKDEIDRAQAEIEQWRESQWERIRQVADQRQEREQQQSRKERENRKQQQHLEKDKKAKQDIQRLEQKTQEEALDQEARQKAAKAAKRKRAKERKKNQNAHDRLEQEKRDNETALKAQKEASANKCAACQGGIVDGGFEKFGKHFCSTKCARAGPSSSS